MKIMEVTFTVNQRGSLKIPKHLLEEMGLAPADHVRVAYITDDGSRNVYREFMLSSDYLEDTEQEQRIAVPQALLDQANISADSDLQVVCTNGAVILCEDPILGVDELKEVLDGMGLASDILARLSYGDRDVLLALRDGDDGGEGNA